MSSPSPVALSLPNNLGPYFDYYRNQKFKILKGTQTTELKTRIAEGKVFKEFFNENKNYIFPRPSKPSYIRLVLGPVFVDTVPLLLNIYCIRLIRNSAPELTKKYSFCFVAGLSVIVSVIKIVR